MAFDIKPIAKRVENLKHLNAERDAREHDHDRARHDKTIHPGYSLRSPPYLTGTGSTMTAVP